MKDNRAVTLVTLSFVSPGGWLSVVPCRAFHIFVTFNLLWLQQAVYFHICVYFWCHLLNCCCYYQYWHRPLSLTSSTSNTSFLNCKLSMYLDFWCSVFFHQTLFFIWNVNIFVCLLFQHTKIWKWSKDITAYSSKKLHWTLDLTIFMSFLQRTKPQWLK